MEERFHCSIEYYLILTVYKQTHRERQVTHTWRAAATDHCHINRI